MRYLVASVVLAVVWFPVAAAAAQAAGSPLARGEHPRLYLTKAGLPAMRVKVSTVFREEFQAFVDHLDDVYPTAAADSDAWENIANYAFLYQLDPATLPRVRFARRRLDYGNKAREILLQSVRAGRQEYTQAIGYDWLFDLLTPGDRITLVTHLKSFREPRATRNPLDDQPMHVRERYVTAGLAFYRDLTGRGQPNEGNLAALDRTASYTIWIQGDGTSAATAGNFIAGTGGGWSQGYGYSNKPATIAILRTMEAYRTANALSKARIYQDATVFRHYPRWLAYHLLPQGNNLLWRTHYMDAALRTTNGGGIGHLLGALRLYKGIDDDCAGLAQWLMTSQGAEIRATRATYRHYYLFGHFILGERVVPRSPTEIGLPVTRRFDSYGWVAMRTQWTPNWVDQTDSMVTLAAATWSRHGTYWQPHNPSFTIDRRGPLVIHSGTVTHQAYAARSWAGNTIIFPDPNEENVDPQRADMGGQRRRFTNVTSIDMLTPGSLWDVGGIKRFQPFVPGDRDQDFDYIYADATRAYNGPANHDGLNTEKVRRFTRQLVYFRPAMPGDTDRIIIFDRTESMGARFEKRWIFHPSREPVIGGTVVRNSPVRGRSGEGKTTYTGAGNEDIVVTNDRDGSSGQLWVTALLPRARQVVKVGGGAATGEWGRPARRGDTGPPSHEFEDPYGIQNPRRNTYEEEDAQYVGRYRVEIIPATPALQNDFLHVFEAGDTDDTQSPTVLLSGTNFIGARIRERIVMFGPIGRVTYAAGVESEIVQGDFVIDEAGSYRVLVTDLKPSSLYAVRYNGQLVTKTASSAGLLSLAIEVPAATRVSIQTIGMVR